MFAAAQSVRGRWARGMVPFAIDDREASKVHRSRCGHDICAVSLDIGSELWLCMCAILGLNQMLAFGAWK